MDSVKRLAAVSPSMIMAWLNAFVKPLDGTPLAYYRWQESADKVGAWISTIVIFVVLLLGEKIKREVAYWISLICLAAGILLAAACFAADGFINSVPSKESVETIRSLWAVAYTAMIISAVSSILFAFHYWAKD